MPISQSFQEGVWRHHLKLASEGLPSHLCLEASFDAPQRPGQPVDASPAFSLWFTSTVKPNHHYELVHTSRIPTFVAVTRVWVPKSPDSQWDLHLCVPQNYSEKETDFKWKEEFSLPLPPLHLYTWDQWRGAGKNSYLPVSLWKVLHNILAQLQSESLASDQPAYVLA